MEALRAFNSFMILVFILSGMASTLINITFLHIVLWGPKRRRSPVKLLLVNLCVCNLIIALLVIPVTCLIFLDVNPKLGSFFCKSLNFTNSVIVFASVFTLTSICTLRSLGVRDIVVGRDPVQRPCLLIIFIIWAFSSLLSTPIALIYDTKPLSANSSLHNACVKNWKPIISFFKTPVYDDLFAAELSYSVLVIIMLYLLPSSIIFSCYMKICLMVDRNVRFLGSTVSDPEASAFCRRRRCSHQLARANRMFKLSVLLVVVFAFCWLPYHLLSLSLDVFTYTRPPYSIAFYKSLKDLLFFFIWMALTSSAVSPIFLFVTDLTYRRCLRVLFFRGANGANLDVTFTDTCSNAEELRVTPGTSSMRS